VLSNEASTAGDSLIDHDSFVTQSSIPIGHELQSHFRLQDAQTSIPKEKTKESNALAPNGLLSSFRSLFSFLHFYKDGSMGALLPPSVVLLQPNGIATNELLGVIKSKTLKNRQIGLSPAQVLLPQVDSFDTPKTEPGCLNLENKDDFAQNR
jgi:hypothetical protein